jgi:hypothetical protein
VGSILQKVRPEDVKMAPYPHVIIEEALPWDVYEQLAAAYPDDDSIVEIAQGQTKVGTGIRPHLYPISDQ